MSWNERMAASFTPSSAVRMNETCPQRNVGTTEIQLIQWERELLRRERELLVRERQSMTESKLESGSPVPKFKPKDVVDLIPIFDPSKPSCLTINQWISKVETVSDSYHWDDGTTLLQAISKLKGAARVWYEATTINLTTWAKLSREIITAFPNGRDESDIHLELTMKRKKKEETFEEYFYDMMAISRKGPISDQALMKYIITGIGDAELTKTLALSEYADPQQLLRRIKRYEDTMCQARHRKELQTREMFKSADTKPNLPRTPKAASTPKGRPDIKCYNCGENGHLGRECKNKEKGIKCFSCNQHGHKAADCPKKKEDERKSSKETEKRSVYFAKEVPDGLYKNVKLEGKMMSALIDTGSSLTLLKQIEYMKLPLRQLTGDNTKLFGLGAQVTETLGCLYVTIEIDQFKFPTKVHIVPDDAMVPQMIVGNDVLKKAEIKISNGNVQILKGIEDSAENVEEVKIEDTKKEEEALMNIMLIEVDEEDLNVSNTRYREQIGQIVRQYSPKCTKSTGITLKINLLDNQPVFHRPRRLASCENEKVSGTINQWLEDGIIQPSCSDYSSPVVPVKKKDGSIRVCIDYRELNRKTIKDRYPLPVIEDQLDKLRDFKVFTVIDLKSGFHHVPVEENSRKYTSFVTHDGQYEFLRMPFGLSNAPSVFQRYINTVFHDLISKNELLTYMDDLVIPAKSYEDGLVRLQTTLRRAEEHGLEINWKKCQFLREDIEYLGHRVTNNTIRPSTSKVTAVMKFPEPRNPKQLQSFLGLTGYFRKFIPNYSIIAKPLSDLLKKQNTFNFGASQQIAFQSLKKMLSEEPVLKIYKPDAYTELHTDASREGYGAVLLQRDDDDKKLHPVYYTSRKTNDAEKNYHSYELEMLAVIRALERLRVYLLGIKFKIITDCAAFKMSTEKRDVSAKVWRWISLLQEYDYEIQHRKGAGMKHCDALSRYPIMTITDSGVTPSVIEAQKKDVELKPIFELLKKGNYDNYQVRNGVLYKNDGENELLVVPKRMGMEIVRQTHEKGHFGRRKVEEMLNKEYFIPKLAEKIDSVVKSCVPCIMAMAKTGKQEGFLNPICKGDAPLQTYHIDHLGPLPSTKKSYNYLLVVVDGFTKFTWIYATKSTGTKEVLDKLNVQQQVFGNPRRMVTDRGAAFTSKDFSQYCEDEHIEHSSITTGVPRGNGQVERMHQTIISVLTKLSIENPREWYKYVSRVQQFLNSTYQRSIDTSPFKLMVGSTMALKDDVRIRQLIEEEKVNSHHEERHELRLRAKEQILKVQRENERSYNKRRKTARRYEVGSLVAIKRTQFGTGLKLYPKYLGPYKVVTVFRRDRYQVEKIGTGEGPTRTSSSADHMKPWTTNAETDEDSDCESDVEDNTLPDDNVTEASHECRNGRAVGFTSRPWQNDHATGDAQARKKKQSRES